MALSMTLHTDAAPRDARATAPGSLGTSSAGELLPGRPLRPPPVEVAELVRLVLASGSSMWVRARGASMRPAIPHGAAVHLVPTRETRPGDIVLAILPTGEPLLHRVARVRGTRITLRGDSLLRADPAIAIDAVIGVVDLVRVGGRTFDAAERPRASRAPLVRRVRHKARRAWRAWLRRGKAASS
jgi:peptidase S24-like protein